MSRKTGRPRLRRDAQSETGWVTKLSYLPGLGFHVAAQVNGTVHQWAPALRREPANKSLKSIKHLNSYVKPAYFRTSMKQSVDNKTGTFLLFAPFLYFIIN